MVLFISILASFIDDNVQFFDLRVEDSKDKDILEREIFSCCRFYYGTRKRGLLGMEEDPSVTNESPEAIWEVGQRLSKRLPPGVSIRPIYRLSGLIYFFDPLVDHPSPFGLDILRVYFDPKSKATERLLENNYLSFLETIKETGEFDVDSSFKPFSLLKKMDFPKKPD
jgi:hypothetical protein